MRFAFSFLLVLLILCSGGCTRTRYRAAADRDSYQIIQEKAACAGTQIHPGFQVAPDPRSRFYDPTNPDCPQLPVPRPVLNGYTLPPLATTAQQQPARDADAQQNSEDASKETDLQTSSDQSSGATTEPQATEPQATGGEAPAALPKASSDQTSTLFPAIPLALPHSGIQIQTVPDAKAASKEVSVPDSRTAQQPSSIALMSYQEAASPKPTLNPPTVQAAEPPVAEQIAAPESQREAGQSAKLPEPPRSSGSPVNRVAIPRQAWEVLPQNCLDRMLEFDTLRDEYRLTFQQEGESSSSRAEKLTLANLMELATINSREFQTRKELLFVTALALTRRRYQFELNPTPFGNGIGADYRHVRNNGIEQNQLLVPSGVAVQRTFATGGEFLARFANSVVLTFNGPSGFAKDISSNLVFDFQQTIFQRDVRFENLTQAERDVVYAMREYLRFRKQLFRDVANQYYNLLLSYRGIEINAQDYFTNLRGFIQSQAEYRTAEKIPRIQVDQFEQNVLRARSNLVNNCFALEAALDQLKFRLGLPVEMTIFLDLDELASISLKDELSVARQMITRARAELLSARSASVMDATTLANVAEVLADRMANILRIQRRMEVAAAEQDASSDARQAVAAIDKSAAELEQLQQLLVILGVRMQVDLLRAELDTQLNAQTPAPPLRVLIRAIEYSSSQLQVIDLAVDGKAKPTVDAAPQDLSRRRDEAKADLQNLVKFVEKISSSLASNRAVEAMDDLAQIPNRMEESVELTKRVEKLASDATKEIFPTDNKSIESIVQSTVDETIELSDRLLAKGPDGWKEIEIDPNEALLTALVQRLDLMNERGDLADAWRQIKLAGDDLRSIVDLQATQTLRTKTGSNNPFDFSFDDSQTRLSVALDTPLNRRLQRNNFRVALISYNVGLRNLIAAEDAIKLDVREDLRQLALDRNQYTIAVASAALAYERVISTRLRLQFGVQNVAARDFLESQQAYTNALSAIARQHVNYITDRTELFFDLEAFDVDQYGHWAGVSEDDGPLVNTNFPLTNRRPYDCLPQGVWYSPTIRQMEQIGPGEAVIYAPEAPR